jgi:hypothetical protein
MVVAHWGVYVRYANAIFRGMEALVVQFDPGRDGGSLA